MKNHGTQLSKLDEMIDGLTAVRQFLDNHPELPPVAAVGSEWVHLWLHGSDFASDDDCRQAFADCTRAFMDGAPVGSVRKEATDFSQQVIRRFGPVELKLHISRYAVCERRVVGVEKVRVPDPEAPTVEVEREVVEWVCEPILATSDAHVAHYAGMNAAAEDEKAVSA